METILLGLLAILVTAAFFFAKDFNAGSKRHTVARVIVGLLAVTAVTLSIVFVVDIFVLVENNNQCVP